jgi:hypothetical protein
LRFEVAELLFQAVEGVGDRWVFRAMAEVDRSEEDSQNNSG